MGHQCKAETINLNTPLPQRSQTTFQDRKEGALPSVINCERLGDYSDILWIPLKIEELTFTKVRQLPNLDFLTSDEI